MKAINDFANVKASTGEWESPKVGGYICVITEVEDVQLDANTGKGDYLKIEYDIDEGDFEGYYKDLFHSKGYWGGRMVKSYKEKALGMFKHFIDCVEQSNKGYKWNWEEKTLINKKFGAVFGEEEYRKNDGSVGTRLVVSQIKTIEQIKKGDYKIPQLKKLKDGSTSVQPQQQEVTFSSADDSDVPF